MFGNLVAAFGLTILCLAPIMLVALIVPFVFMRINQPADEERNIVGRLVAYARYYLLTVVTLATVTVAFWWGFITFTGVEAATDFAGQSLPFEEDVIEGAVEPALEITATPEG